ncbi:MAG: hypothetical protein C4527_08975 [Candidatus Omnitrophota bacterium]|jgi:hypothetical protein|nr:MAG: hypothetical protein C4527_08975 [Candidatus Omnitrophota bacterium]
MNFQTPHFYILALALGLFLVINAPAARAYDVGDAVPNLDLVSSEGLTLSLHPREGILFIWFQNTESWQTTNVADEILMVYRRFHEKGMNILGVCTDTFEDDVFDFSQVWQIPWPQVMDKEWRILQKLGLEETASNLIIDSAGEILAKDVSIADLHPVIEEIIAGLLHTVPMPAASSPISTTKRDWGPEQAAGAPDTPEAGDYASAWASRTPDGQDEWLKLKYDIPIQPIQIQVYETLNPGAVCKISATHPSGEEVIVWQGTDPTPTTAQMGISTFPCPIDFKTNQIKIDLDSRHVAGLNEIDAVALVDASGTAHWAVDAEASSTYAQELQTNVGLKSYFFPTERQVSALSELKALDQALGEMEEISLQARTLALPVLSGVEPFRLHIKAYVEGASVLVFREHAMRWYRVHTSKLAFAHAPATIHPTSLNGVEWTPDWCAVDTNGDLIPSQWSSICAAVSPAIPRQDMQVELKIPQASLIHCLCEQKGQTATSPLNIGQAPRGSISVLEHPTAGNGYVLALLFEPFKQDGADWFECIADIRPRDPKLEFALADPPQSE